MDELSKFIKENAELINNNDFNAVYLGSFFILTYSEGNLRMYYMTLG